MTKTNVELKKAYDKLEEISNDSYMQRIAELRHKAILNYNSAMSSKYKDGEKAGYERGERAGIYKLVKKMLENGESIDKIKLYSGFSSEEIDNIRKTLI